MDESSKDDGWRNDVVCAFFYAVAIVGLWVLFVITHGKGN